MRLKTCVWVSLFVAAGLLSGCVTPSPTGSSALPSAPNRRIALYNTETGEHLETAFRTNGGYDQDGMTRISQFMRDRRTGEVQPVDPALIDMMGDVLAKLNLPESTEIYVNSGYRSPASNAILAKTNANVAEDSYHLKAQAVDIRIPGVPLGKLALAAYELHRGGYALYASHVHVDTGPFRTWGRPFDHETGDVMIAAAPAKAATPPAKSVRVAVEPARKPASVAVVPVPRLPPTRAGIVLAKAEIPQRPSRPPEKTGYLRLPTKKPVTP